jgi:hypothetical protein
MRMIRIFVLDFLVVSIVIYRIFLIVKIGPSLANYIILLLKLKGMYMDDDNNNRLPDPTLEDLFHSVSTSTSPRLMLPSHQRHRLLLHMLPR